MHLFFLVLLALYLISLFRPVSAFNKSLSKDTTLYLKGIFSLLIITCHMASNTEISFFSYFKPWGAPIVSLFFFISGYGLMSSYLSKGQRYLDGFLKKRVWKILLPYLIITFLYIALNAVDKERFSWTILSDFIVKGIPPLPYSWFVISIIVLYLFFYWSFSPRRLVVSQKLFLCLLLSCLYILIAILIGYDRCWWVSTLGFVTGLFYRYYELYLVRIFRSKIYRLLFMPICSLAIYLLSGSPVEFVLSVAYVLIPSLVIVLINYLKFRKNLLLSFFGDISYEIYLCQGVCFVLLRGHTIYIASDYVYAFMVYFVTVFLAYSLHLFILKNDENITNR